MTTFSLVLIGNVTIVTLQNHESEWSFKIGVMFVGLHLLIQCVLFQIDDGLFL